MRRAVRIDEGCPHDLAGLTLFHLAAWSAPSRSLCCLTQGQVGQLQAHGSPAGARCELKCELE
eukprot:754826-Hanusia_phi.AAC.5